MAPLNPTLQPTNDPNYRGYSQPINVPDTIKPQGVQTNQIMPQGQQIGDKSAEYEGKSEAYKMAADSTAQEAYGDLFKNIAQMGDFVGKAGVAVVKKDIEDKVYNIADRERQQYTQTLEQIKASGSVTGILAGDSGTPDSPQEIQDLGDHLSSLQSAKNGGKISSTYYESRLLAEAKKLRAQYPGFRQEIDEQFAKVTGSNPANAYIRALTSDINKAATSASSQMKAAQSFVAQRNEYPGAEEIMAGVQSGQIGLPEAMRWAAPYDRRKAALTEGVQELNLAKGTREEQQTKAGLLFDKGAGTAVSQIADKMAVKMGIYSAEDANRLDAAVKSGAVDTKILVQQGHEIGQRIAQVRVQMNRDAAKFGITEKIGQTEVNKRIDAAVQPLKDLQDSLYNKDVGTFYRSQQDIKAYTDDAQKALLQHPKLGPPAQVFSAFKNLVGESNLGAFSMDIIKGDFPEDLKTYYGQLQKNFATQFNMKTTGIPVTFNDVVDDLKNKAKTDSSYNNKRLNNAIFNEVNKITNPSLPDEVRLNYAQAAFSPGNRGMISKLSADGVDSMGRPITGQAAIFQKFTTPEMTKAMFELGKKDPQAWVNYTNWAQETLGNELANKDINTLAQIRNPAITVGWDSDNKRLVPRYDEGPSVNVPGRAGLTAGGVSAPGRAATDTEYQNVQRVVARMNGYLGNYKNIAEAAGVPVDAFLIKTIANVNPEAVQNAQGIPFRLLRDLGLSQMKGLAGPR